MNWQETLNDQAQRQLNYDARQTGRRLLDKPDESLISEVFDGSYKRYASCVKANFGELPVPEQFIDRE